MARRFFVFAIFAFFFATASRAQEMNGYIAPMGLFAVGSGADSGTRTGVKIEFARLHSYISADLKFGSGQGYTDYGGALKFFRHFSFNTDKSTGLSAGAGVGANYSADKIAATGNRSFYEPYLYPFARFLLDFGNGFGVNAEVGYEFVLSRRFNGGGVPNSDTAKRGRIVFALGIPFGV